MHSILRQPNRISALGTAIVLLTLGAAQALAQDVAVNCEIPADQEIAEHFPQLQQKARAINSEACLALLSRDFEGFGARQNNLYRQFGVNTKSTAKSAFTSAGIQNLDVPFDDWIERISTSDFKSKALPKFSVDAPPGPSLVFHFDNTSKRGTLSDRGCHTTQAVDQAPRGSHRADDAG